MHMQPPLSSRNTYLGTVGGRDPQVRLDTLGMYVCDAGKRSSLAILSRVEIIIAW